MRSAVAGIMAKRSVIIRQTEGSMRLFLTGVVGIVFGILIGVSLPTQLSIEYGAMPTITFPNPANRSCICPPPVPPVQCSSENINSNIKDEARNLTDPTKIWEPSNPRGTERLPARFIQPESDLYIRRLWGKPNEDLKIKPKYLVAFTVGYDQKSNIDAAVKKFSEDFQIILFHYDGRTTEWDEFEWSKNAIHISTRKQTKWWFAKRFLHPDIVAAYDYIFIWDEDLGVEHFDGEEYIKLMKKYGLEISQPALDSGPGSKKIVWKLTEKRNDTEVHKSSEVTGTGRPCLGPHLPPCAAFVEIMAPVFSREAWRCVWHMIQNDLVHGWGIDFALGNCVEPAHEKIGVVDAQWILHQGVPSLGKQGEGTEDKSPWRAVRERCSAERNMLKDRFIGAQRVYYQSKGIEFPLKEPQWYQK